MNIREIREILPHRYPLLMIDRVVELQEGTRVVAIKNVTVNEEYFNGHFPSAPVMPGVMILEAMAQAGGLAMLATMDFRDRLPLFAGVDHARFRRTVVPGDQLRIEVEVKHARSGTAKLSGKAYVGSDLAAEAELIFVLSDVSKLN
ncbi:MAG: 3-hydroxyacyl-ACP dehydratase FabZ [Firmicutes bacterium]|nr:3-hydroxyacyl-ACP dehydratase FabZ [Bacillota bacterium]